ncbi:MAG: glycosyltransferase family 4 protein [Firmicutes bacterium]|nr:glycosyltransferase family 4 protein [Bacillota bacterium]
MSRIKVLHIITDRDIGSAGQHILTLFDACNSTFAMQVLLPEDSGLKSLFKQNKIPCRFYDSKQTGVWAEAMAIKQKIKEFMPDILHTHSCFIGRIAARMFGKCKHVHTQHEVVQAGFFAKLLAGKKYVSIAAFVNAHKNLLETGVPSAKIRMIYNGVHSANEYAVGERLRLQRQFNIPDNSFVVTCTAKLTNVYDYVLDTARELPYNVIILIAGADGGHKPHMRRRIKKEQLQNVRLLDYVQSADKLMCVTDVQINLSKEEDAIPIPILFGMSIGKPVISTQIDSHVIKDGVNGIVVPAEDAQALDDAITKIKDAPDLYKELSDGARLLYTQQFTAERMAQEIENVYKELI